MSGILWQIAAVLALASLLFFGRNVGLRTLARIPFRWTFNPANTFALVVTEKNEKTEEVQGGNIVDVLHAIPGKQLVRQTDDVMNWYVEEGSDPDHQNYLYKKLGIQDMGSFFYTLRTNVVKRERYARDPEKPEKGLGTVGKEEKTQHVHFSGEMEITIKGSDTTDGVPLIFKINFIYERKFPVRSILRLADAPAFLVSLVKAIVNNETSIRPVLAYYGEEGTKENREKLEAAIDENAAFKKRVEDQLGLDIKTVAIHDVDIPPEFKATFAKKLEAEKSGEAAVIKARKDGEVAVLTATKQGEAALITARQRGEAEKAEAEGQKAALLLRTEGEEDRLQKILLPAAANEHTSKVFRSDRESKAYENNRTVTHWVGGSAEPTVPL